MTTIEIEIEFPIETTLKEIREDINLFLSKKALHYKIEIATYYRNEKTNKMEILD